MPSWSADVVALLEESYRFNGMADFAYLEAPDEAEPRRGGCGPSRTPRES